MCQFVEQGGAFVCSRKLKEGYAPTDSYTHVHVYVCVYDTHMYGQRKRK